MVKLGFGLGTSCLASKVSEGLISVEAGAAALQRQEDAGALGTGAGAGAASWSLQKLSRGRRYLLSCQCASLFCSCQVSIECFLK